jgi:CDP-4-dehydro-6-deoxyglucose reductase, E3
MAGPLIAELTGREVIAPGIADLELTMRSPDRLDFRAGQFVSIAVDGAQDPDPIPRRSYSIASQSDAGDKLRFIIRVIPGGRASDYLMALPVGAPLAMTGPHGFFVLDPVHPGDIVFGATGTGIAAVMPMLGELARRPDANPGRRLIFWGVRHEADLFAREEIAALADRSGAQLILYLTAPDPSWTGERGRITAAIVDRLPELASPTFYLVGNGAMITDLKRELVSRGVNRKRQIRTEAFFD